MTVPTQIPNSRAYFTSLSIPVLLFPTKRVHFSGTWTGPDPTLWHMYCAIFSSFATASWKYLFQQVKSSLDAGRCVRSVAGSYLAYYMSLASQNTHFTLYTIHCTFPQHTLNTTHCGISHFYPGTLSYSSLNHADSTVWYVLCSVLHVAWSHSYTLLAFTNQQCRVNLCKLIFSYCPFMAIGSCLVVKPYWTKRWLANFRTKYLF